MDTDRLGPVGPEIQRILTDILRRITKVTIPTSTKFNLIVKMRVSEVSILNLENELAKCKLTRSGGSTWI